MRILVIPKNISKHPFASPDKIKVMRSEKEKSGDVAEDAGGKEIRNSFISFEILLLTAKAKQEFLIFVGLL